MPVTPRIIGCLVSAGLLLALAVAGLSSQLAAQPQSPPDSHEAEQLPKHWYGVTVAMPMEQGFQEHYGSSSLAEEAFAGQLEGVRPLVLSDLRAVFNSLKGFEEWTRYYPYAQDRVYLNPKYVIEIRPLDGDPKGKRTVY